MIVVFSGVDGAGKSTQIKHLTHFLGKQEKTSTVVWSRGGYTPGMEWVKKWVRKLSGRKIPDSGISKARSEVLSKKWVAYAWLTFAMLDLMILYGVLIRFRSFIGEIVVCDRYLIDTQLDFQRNFPQIKIEKMLLWRILKAVSPKADSYFLLWVPVAESIQRSIQKEDPFPNDQETLRWRLEKYMDNKFIAKEYLMIDCRNSVDDVSNEIQCHLNII